MTDKAKESKPLDDAAILAKAKSGEALTSEEQEHIAGAPALEGPGAPAPAKKESEEESEEGGEPEAEAGDEDPEGDAATQDGEENPDEEPEEGEDAGDEPAEGSAKKTPEQKKALVEAELAKPDDQQDLSKFKDDPVLLGLYWDLKKQRRKNQKLEQENRELKFADLKRALKENAEEAAEGEEDEEEDPLAGREDDDILTVADVKKLLAKKPAPKEKKPAEGEGAAKPIVTAAQIRTQSVEADARLKAKGVTDFTEVSSYAEYALAGDLEAQEELRDTALAGGNVAEKTYWLVRGSKKWPAIQKALAGEGGEKKTGAKKPSSENLSRAERIQQNGKKIKTTGAGGGGAVPVGEYSVEQIAAMSPKDFGKLPKATQDAILLKFGSEPNYDK